MQKAYNRINWENYPEIKTPLNEANMNRMDAAIDELDNRVISLDTTKATKTEVSELFSEISFDESSGVLTFTRKNGGTVKIDTKLEKLAVNFAYDAENERLVITLDDGSVQYVDMKALITQYEFTESDTIILSVDSAGKVSASIKNGSITGEMLEPNYLANVTVQAESASASAASASASAQSAKEDADRAEDAAGRAEAIAGFTIDTTLDTNSSNPIANKAVAEEFGKYVPKSGGAIEGSVKINQSYIAPLVVNNTGNDVSYTAYMGENLLMGYLGMDGENKPSFQMVDGTRKALLHTGNMANLVLPLTGGIVNGNVTVKANDTSQRIHALQNSVRRVFQTIGTSGNYNLYDNTNNKAIIVSTADGTNTFDGTASGNLPLNGGMLTGNLYFKKVENGQGMVYKDHNTGNDYGMVLRDDDASGNSVRMLLSALSNAIRFRDTTGTYNDIIHSGNITDYVAADSETGTFTLKLNGVTLGTGTYYKVGKMVHCRATGNFPQEFTTGYVSLTGLPFANASRNSSIAEFHLHQYYGKASDNMVFDVTASEITLNLTSSASKGQPFTFSTIYFTE